MQLLIVGKRGWKLAEFDKLIGSDSCRGLVIYVDFVSDVILAGLYRRALCLVLPSLFEGFGFPLIEAMSVDCPVCCSNTSCLPEVAGDAALFFDPYSEVSIAASLEEMRNPIIRARLVELGRLNVRRFTWDRCCMETLKIISGELSFSEDHPTQNLDS
jgi:glycosyltransferase involved in cell wall biosynthesis